jgi:hypothetical protein
MERREKRKGIANKGKRRCRQTKKQRGRYEERWGQSLGLLPEARAREFMMGMKMPPALAVVEGMAGAISASATLRPYARPKVDFPKAFTKSVATRSPRPVFSNPCILPP